MSQLPARPSLSHLRKQAKDLLHQLRRQKPDATLVDAQHALALSYGFESWPKLKIHVERLAGVPQPTFQRYTSKAREAVFFARSEAAQQGSRTIEPEHVLLGLIRASRGLKGFDRLSLERVRIEKAPHQTTDDPISMTARISSGERAKQILRAAADEADAWKHHDIGLVHILLGVLREPGSTAALLDRTGIRLQPVRDDIAVLLTEEADRGSEI